MGKLLAGSWTADPATAKVTHDVQHWELQAPSRLHFGLLSFGRSDRPCYGGAGLMIRHPGLRLRIGPAQRFVVIGPEAERMGDFARRWADFHQLPLPAIQVELKQAPPAHVGLGSGTTLALGMAAALHRVSGMPLAAPAELAQSVQRGLRSAVGTYGFLQGGFLIEQGKQSDEVLAPLDCRLPVPPQWRVILLRPRGYQGLSGIQERAAFESLPAPSQKVTEALQRELREQMAPALLREDLPRFGESVFRYGRLAGSCFAAMQGGPYNGPLLSAIVARIRSWGYAGVGQSSWGPTLFTLVEDSEQAETFLQRWRHECGDLPILEQLSEVDNRGARWRPGAADDDQVSGLGG